MLRVGAMQLFNYKNTTLRSAECIRGQLIVRKISKICATRCQTLKLKCTKFSFRWGSVQDPAQRYPASLAVFKGPTFGGGEGKVKEGRGDEVERATDLAHPNILAWRPLWTELLQLGEPSVVACCPKP